MGRVVERKKEETWNSEQKKGERKKNRRPGNGTMR